MIHSHSEQKVVTTSMTSTRAPTTQQKKVDKVVEEYKDIFTLPTRVPLDCQVKHSINLIPGTPLPNGPIDRCLLLQNEEIKGQIQELIQKGHIRPRSCPCRSLVVLVQKKDVTWQLCIDYKSLNKVTIRNQYPIPRIDNLLDQLKGTKFFSRVDLMLGYHQVPIEQTNVWKTALKSKEGLFNGWPCLFI